MVRSLNSSVTSMRAINAFGSASRATASQLSKLSSGSRIPNAKEDVASLSISKGIALEISALKSARNNLLQASSMLQMADSALGDVTDILNRMESVATMARNSTNSTVELQALDLEYQQLVGAMDTIVSGTEFNGKSLLGEQPEFRVAIVEADIASDNGFVGYNVEPDFALHQDGDQFEVTYNSATSTMTLHHVREDRYQTLNVSAVANGVIEDLDFNELGITVKLNDAFDPLADIDPAVNASTLTIGANVITPPTFAPSDIAGLAVHHSAVDSALNLTGNGVRDAGDIEVGSGGNNNLYQNSGGRRPDLEINGVFGRDAFDFDGSEFFRVNNNAVLNTSSHNQKSFAFSFRTGGDVTTTQNIWEEGAGVNGMNAYIDGGRLYFGIYRANGGVGSWLSTAISPSTDYTTSFTFDRATNSTTMYLNGAQVATGAGLGAGQALPAHSGGMAMGRTNGTTIYHSGLSTNNGDYFTGRVGEFIYYNNALSAAEHADLDTYMNNVVFSDILFNSEEIDIQAASGSDMVDRVALDIPKMAEQVYLIAQTNVLSDSAAGASHTQIGIMMDAVNAARADLGSFMNRLSFAEGVVSVSIENQSGAESVLSDADIAREMTEFMSQSMRLNVASEMIQQSQQSGQHVLSLLSGSLGEAA